MPAFIERIRAFLGGTGQLDRPSSALEAPEPTTERSPIPHADLGFALAMYWQLHQGRRNLFFSPLNIRCALGMALLGARAETAAQLSRALDIGSSGESSEIALGGIVRRLEEAGNGRPEIGVANSLWSQVGAPLEAEFLELIAERYGGSMHAVDFHNACDAARAEINRWVEERTRQRIRELIPPGGLAVDTRLVLASAVYFRGLWSLQFDQSRTRDKRFYTEGGRRVRVPLMRKRAMFRYVAASGYQAVDLDYQGSDLAMLVLLPDRRDGLHDLEKALSARLLAHCLAQMASCEVELLLPRFRLTWGTVDLIRHLRAIGIELPFTGRADFSGINGHSPPDLEALFISQVLHKAFVEVNEEGTEAAAATALRIVSTSARFPQFPQPVPVFRANHPFLFAIHDRETGEILFLGRSGDPTEEHCS